MRRILPPLLENGRLTTGYMCSPSGSGPYGAFQMQRPYEFNKCIRIIACGAELEGAQGWEHVSVSLEHRCPTWDEMAYVKRLFWLDEETVIQIHPPEKDYVNYHPYCLHLWRNIRQEFIMPPRFMLVPSAEMGNDYS